MTAVSLTPISTLLVYVLWNLVVIFGGRCTPWGC
jgi:hypothetical protein